MSDFVITEDGWLVDQRPVRSGKLPLALYEGMVWDALPSFMTLGDLMDGFPVKEEDVPALIASGKVTPLSL